MRILILEDNVQVARALERGLQPYYAVDVALTGKSGLQHTSSTKYDAILLDLNLPDIDGEKVCQELRSDGVKSPIIVITGRDSLDDKVSLLDMGADDYLTKPVHMHEVQARLRTAMRHGESHLPEAIITVNELVLDPAGRTVHQQGQLVVLRRKEFDVLEYLMRNPGQTLTRNMILGHVWDINENLWANVVDVHIKHLRDKLERPFGVKFIQTMHGMGYKIETSTPVGVRD